MRSSVAWSNTRAAITAHMLGHRARDVFDGLARVEADFLVADVDRVAAERRDRDLDRDPRARRRLLEQRGDALPGEHRFGTASGAAFHPIGAVEDARQRRRDRGRRPRGSRRVMPAPSASTAARIATASSISASVTSSDGASRKRAAGHRVDDQARRPGTAARRPWRRSRARARPRAAARGRAPRRRRRPSATPSASRAPARSRALGNLLALHHVEHRERGARGERLAAERRRVIARARTRRRPRRAPSTHRSARRCRAPWPS